MPFWHNTPSCVKCGAIGARRKKHLLTSSLNSSCGITQ